MRGPGTDRLQPRNAREGEMLTFFFFDSFSNNGRHFHQDCEEAIEALHPTSV